MTPDALYAEVVAAFSGKKLVTYGGKGFGGTALKADGKIFAMLSSRAEFVVKLPRARAAALVAAGAGRPFDANKGRPMKEWVVIPAAATATPWIAFATEAYKAAIAAR